MKSKIVFLIGMIVLIMISFTAVCAYEDNSTYEALALEDEVIIDSIDEEDQYTESAGQSDILLEESGEDVLAGGDEFNISEAYDAVNEFRAEKGIWYWNSDDKTVTYFNTDDGNQLMPLKRDDALEQAAKIRAQEFSQYPSYGHTRPDGSTIWTLGVSYLKAENLAATSQNTLDIMRACVIILKEETDPSATQGHRRAMLNRNYDCIGIAAVKQNGMVYMAMELGYKGTGITPPVHSEQPLLKSQKPFTDLNSLIQSKTQIILDNDYVYITSTDSGLKNGIEIKKSVTINGKGHLIDARNLAKIFKITSGNVVFKNVTFKNTNLYGSRGAISADNCQVSFINCVFTDNTACYGAICSANAKLSVEKCTFKNNFAIRGGAIFLENSISTITDSQFINNTGILKGGALYSVNGNITVVNSDFNDNYVDKYVFNEGGAIYSSDKIISIYKSNLSNNIANKGGAISLYSANAIITNSQFNNGTAILGGAVFSNKSQILFNECSFMGNHLDSVYRSSFNGGAMNFVNSEISIVKSNFTNNTSPERGGTICSLNSKISIEKSNFISNSALECGSVLNSNNDNISIINSNFIKNKVNSTYSVSSGGMVYSVESDISFKGCNIKENVFDGVTDSKGLIYSDKYISVEDCSFVNNLVMSHTMNSYFKNGGGVIYTTGGEAIVKNSNFTGNIAKYSMQYNYEKYGAGALSLINTNARIEWNYFKNNTGIYGGAVYLKSSNATINSCNFTSNSADYGGAMYFVDSEISIMDSNFINNTSPKCEGTIGSTNSRISIEKSNFIGNTGLAYGSVLNSKKDNISIINSNFLKNKINTTFTVSSGGLINLVESNISFKGCNIKENVFDGVTDSKGLIYSDKYISVEDCSFVNNLVMSHTMDSYFKNGGGVIYTTGGEAIVKNSNFTGNVAKYSMQYNYGKYGAGALSLINTNVRMEWNYFKNNTGIYGGAVYLESSNATINCCNFRNNNADYGGAIYFSKEDLNCDQCTFINNTVKSKGNLLYLNEGKAKILNSCFDKNPDELIYGEVTLKNYTIIAPKKTRFVCENFTTYEKSNEVFSIKLVDKSGKAVSNKQITVKIGSTTYNLVTNSDGVATKKISLNAGKYKTVVNFLGNEDYLSCTSTVYIIVKQKVTITSDLTKYADNVYLNLTLSKNINTSVIIEFNGKNKTYNFINGVCNVQWNKLKNGNYAINVYMDNGKFVYNKISDSIKINVKKTQIIAENFTTYNKSKEQFYVKLIDSSGKPLVNKKIILNVINKNFPIYTNNEGIANRSINLNADIYKATLIFEGDDKYTASQTTVYLNVKQKVTITSDLTKYADNVYLNLTLSKNINTSVIIEFNGKNKTYNFINGVCNVQWNKLKNGNYAVNVYMDNGKFVYNKISDSIKINVKKTQIIAENFTTYNKSKEQFYVKLIDSSGKPLVNKKIILNVINKNFPIYTNNEGIANRSINLDADIYKATLIFEGDDNYAASQTTVYLNVKQKVTITMNLTSYADTATADISLSKNINTTFIINTNGKNKTYNFVNGKFTVKWKNLENKEYTFKIYLDDDKFVYNNVSEKILIDVESTYITLDLTPGIAGESTFLTAKLYSNYNYTVANEELEFVIGDETFTKNTFVQIGSASIKYTFDEPGIYPITVNYKGSNYYKASTVTGEIKIRECLNPAVSSTVVYNNASISFDMGKSIEGNMEIAINDGNITSFGLPNWNTYTVKLTKGKGILKLNNLKNRTYSFKLEFENDDYKLSDNTKIYEFTIDSASTSMSAKELIVLVGNEVNYHVILLKGGIPFANQSVDLYINNLHYTGTSNENGTVDFAFNLTVGNYTAVITYEGFNNTFMPSNLVKNILVKTSAITPQNTEFKQNSLYEVNLFDNDGNPLSNNEVIIIIDDVKSTVKTDDSGKLTIPLNLGNGSHNIQIINPATGETINNAIIVKSDKNTQKPQIHVKKVNPKKIIRTKNIVVKKGKKIKFTAKLLNKNGKIIKGKKVTFKFKGKTYKIKTNKKGIATLKIKMKLKKGKYKIKTTYGKYTVKNTIKIK